jgi:hypothetical protein
MPAAESLSIASHPKDDWRKAETFSRMQGYHRLAAAQTRSRTAAEKMLEQVGAYNTIKACLPTAK